jgi:glucosylglycerol-phosphate synthase
VDTRRFPNLSAATVSLTEQDVRRFYKRFSKEAFWPVIFSFVDRASFSRADWEHFLEINRRFAERTAAEADKNALVWLHDYNLWMVPAFLRQLRPDVRIGFFHHTSFPPADVFNVIPWAGEIAGSLAQCDYVGFHIPRYVANFVDVLQSHVQTEVLDTVPCAPQFRVHGVALAVSEMPTRVRAGDRTIRLGAHPVGVNVQAIRTILDTPDAREQYAKVRERFAGTTMVLSVERLDYVKGPIQKVEAFEQLLQSHPELCEKVTLVLVTTPPAAGMEIYDETREAVDEVVGRINGRYRTLDWTPVHYLFRTLPFDEVVVYSAAADVAWITPLRDGLNLVAKEFVAAQQAVDGAGVLVLSEFAGAAVELHGAVLTNPYDAEGLCDDLYHALQLSEEERRQRLRRLARVVEQGDVTAWSQRILRAMQDPDAPERE